ncbi:3'-5' exonuclease [Polaromonas sp. A23]|uniref:3'-5' exonuclease n=1 Tax=Polaromonas sp. A23 TaxID=1944133 RepID=UPI0009871C2D|nr:3'-5' exonuclease [Polaromonas sp. A23]OOG44587.1 3'-5' exonuclease [Polaromonas sp. A23]
MPHLPSPTKEELARLEPLAQLGLSDIFVVSTRQQADEAFQALATSSVLGFDTESKPTFFREQVSEGPHVVQFSALQKAWVFQLHDAGCREAVSALLESETVAKVGFGLAGDHQQIRRTLGVSPRNVLDLNAVFRSRGYAKELGVRGAVAVVFNRRFIKSRKATTSNWANRQLTESQIVYAANDAWAAIQVFDALGLPPPQFSET